MFSIFGKTVDVTDGVPRKYFIIYLIKSMIGASICFFFYRLFPEYPFYWSLVSVLLVLSPNEKETLTLPLTRIKANIIGATIGLIFYTIEPFNAVVLSAAVLVTIVTCYILHHSSTTRSALAALIIVLLHQDEKNDWLVGFERMSSVFLGCIIAIIISFSAIKIEKYIKNLNKKDKKHPKTSYRRIRHASVKCV